MGLEVVLLSLVQVDGGAWSSLTGNSHSIDLAEGDHSISLQATDRVGNIGNTLTETIRIDTSMPELVGWTVDPLTTSLLGTANISYSAYDLLSGIDVSASSLQYGFDSNGVGLTPDLTGQWLELPGSGLERGLVWPIGQRSRVNTLCCEQR